MVDKRTGTLYMYGVREVGKTELITWMCDKKGKLWTRRCDAENACNRANRCGKGKFEAVEFELVESDHYVPGDIA